MMILFVATLILSVLIHAFALVSAERNNVAARDATWDMGVHPDDKSELLRLRIGHFLAFSAYCFEWWFTRRGTGEWLDLELTNWAGLALFLFGVVLFYVSVIALGENFTPTAKIHGANSLVTWGPYKYVRHPIYLSSLVSAVGLLLINFSWLFLVIMGYLLFRLMQRIPKEESALREIHGLAHQNFSKDTGKLIPIVAPIEALASEQKPAAPRQPSIDGARKTDQS